MPDTINVALSIWDPSGTYSRHAGVVIASVLKNTKSNVMFHLLHDETLSDGNKQKLEETATKFDGKVNFIDVTDEMKKHSGVDIARITGAFTPGSVFRLLLPRLTKMSKVIYLDCDVVVNLDIKEFWDIDLDGYYIAAINDKAGQTISDKPLLSNSRFRMWMMDIPLENYFNSGVVMLNLDEIRRDFNLFEEGLKFFEHYERCTEFPDQDLLNKLFSKKTRIIDPKFHVFAREAMKRKDFSNTIWHFTGEKPWNIHLGNPLELLYWQYLKESAWGDRLIEYMLEARSSKYVHVHTSDCYKKIGRRLKLNVVKSLPANILSVLYGELLFRMRNLGR